MFHKICLCHLVTGTPFQILGYINEKDRIFEVKEINAKCMLAYESRPNKTALSKFTSSVGENASKNRRREQSITVWGSPPPNDHVRRVWSGEISTTKCKERALGCVDENVHTLILEVSWPVSENQEGVDLQREGAERMS